MWLQYDKRNLSQGAPQASIRLREGTEEEGGHKPQEARCRTLKKAARDGVVSWCSRLVVSPWATQPLLSNCLINSLLTFFFLSLTFTLLTFFPPCLPPSFFPLPERSSYSLLPLLHKRFHPLNITPFIPLSRLPLVLPYPFAPLSLGAPVTSRVAE